MSKAQTGTKQTQEDVVLQLFNKAKATKAEIAQAATPVWKTSGLFSFSEQTSNRTDIKTCTNKTVLIDALVHLETKSAGFETAAKFLGVEDTKFSWLGFSLEEWKADIKTRVDQLQIVEKRAKLTALEARISKLLTPAQIKDLELGALLEDAAELLA